jgi:hypothetical protein
MATKLEKREVGRRSYKEDDANSFVSFFFTFRALPYSLKEGLIQMTEIDLKFMFGKLKFKK